MVKLLCCKQAFPLGKKAFRKILERFVHQAKFGDGNVIPRPERRKRRVRKFFCAGKLPPDAAIDKKNLLHCISSWPINNAPKRSPASAASTSAFSGTESAAPGLPTQSAEAVVARRSVSGMERPCSMP